MLYISRVAYRGAYRVVDTDDDVEEVATLVEIREAVEAGVEIEGVVYSIKRTNDGRFAALIKSVSMCQPAETVTPLQTKLRVLQGIDLVLYKGVTTTLHWVNKQFKDKTLLRLSTYCKALGAFTFEGNGGPLEKCLIIVLDDKLEIERNAFSNALHRNVMFDIREVTNDAVVAALYEEALHYNMFRLKNMIIDNEMRQKYWEDINKARMEEEFW